MADQHVKGAVSTAKGTVEEALGKATGDRKLEANGKAQKIKGRALGVLADVEDAVARTRHN